MTRISTPLFQERSLNALLDQQSKLSELQFKISTGKEISSPADDPIASSRLLALKQQLSDTEQLQRNIDAADNNLSGEEIVLQDAIRQIQTIKQRAIQANGGTYTFNDIKAIKIEVRKLQEKLLDLANTQASGEFIFSGAKSLTRPVIEQADGTFIYQGDETIKSLNIGPAIDLEINDTAKELFFGLPTDDINLTAISGETAVTSANPGLVAVTTLGVLNANELKLNGILVGAASADGVSTTDSSASAIASAAAINARTNLHGVVATVNSNVVNFGGGTYSTNPLAAGDFTINGVQITGGPATADAQGVADLINTFNITGVTAADNGGNLELTAADGRNIQLTSDGTTASGINFTNFDINGGAALDQVARATVTLNDSASIVIAGSSPGDIGFTAGTYNITANTGTGTISTPYIQSKRPDFALPNENYRIVFDTATTYSIYKESDPFTRITNFETFSSTQTINDALIPQTFPTTYTAGDSIIVEGVLVTISGAPAQGDVFNVDLEEVDTINLFEAITNLITTLDSQSGDKERFSYEIGKAITNLNNAEGRIIDVRSRLGAGLKLAEDQKSTNGEFKFFAQRSISNIEDLDYITAISELVQQQVALQAAQRSIVQVQRLSLFDFI